MSTLTIQPYRYSGTWVFDDARVGLDKEPFVSGIPEMIDRLVENIPGAAKGFNLTFSGQEFPGYDIKIEWERAEMGGNWYHSADYNASGWLCPALFKYFTQAPQYLYVKAEAK